MRDRHLKLAGPKGVVFFLRRGAIPGSLFGGFGFILVTVLSVFPVGQTIILVSPQLSRGCPKLYKSGTVIFC